MIAPRSGTSTTPAPTPAGPALDAIRLHEALGKLAGPRWSSRVAAVLPSTNSTLLQELRDPESGTRTPHVLVAVTQSAGRGRLGRSWQSLPDASLTVSFGVTIDRPLAALEGASLACGLAVRDVLREHGLDATLKWPNDVLVHQRKLAGILVEAIGGSRTTLVVGVGINARPIAIEATKRSSIPPTDLASCGLVDWDPHALIAKLAHRLDARLATLAASGFAAMADEYNAADAFRGRRVTLDSPDGRSVAGIARGVDGRGALLAEVDDGAPGQVMRVIAGEISLRLAPP